MKYFVIIFTFIYSFIGCIKENPQASDLKVGDMIPEFSVMMNDGTSVSDQSLIGNVSFIMFFHTTCPDCQQTLPVIQEIYDAYAQKGSDLPL